MQGALQGPSWPALFSMAVKWVPVQEQTRVIAAVSMGKKVCGFYIFGDFYQFVTTGSRAGMIFAIMTSGYIADALGWEAIFYLVGASGCIWFLLWAFLVHNTPADHPTISKVRLDYIKTFVATLSFQDELQFIESNVQTSKAEKVPFPPFKNIFTSKAYWAFQIAHIGGDYGFWTTLHAGPTYLRNIHHVDLQLV